MKALTNFSSKFLLLHKLQPSSPTHHFCFSKNCFFNKNPNFCFLKLFHNKGNYSVHAVPSENQQVDLGLEPVEPQDQQNEQTNESKFVRVVFQLQKDCDFGEQFLIVGDDPMLGLWNPLDALPMTWSDGHIWTVELDMPAGKSIQYKFILKGKEGVITWQPGPDRIIDTWETMNKIIICEDWENVELQQIIEEDKLSQSNEEPQLVPEVSTSAEFLDNPESNVSIIEDTQIHADLDEKPIDEPVLPESIVDSISSSMEKPMAIIADNIGSSEPEDLVESTSHKRNKRNAIQQSEESADGPKNDDTIIQHDLGYTGNFAAPLKNQEGTIVKSSLFELEGSPALVPGLIPPTEEEAIPSEVEEKISIEPSIEEDLSKHENSATDSSVKAFESQDLSIPENSATDSSVEAFETQDLSIPENFATDSSVEAFETQEQNIPEIENVQLISKEQESNEGLPQEISATINGQSELLDNEQDEQFHLAPTMEEDRSNSKPPEEINAIINSQSESRDNQHEEQFHLAPTTMEEDDGSNSQPVYGNALRNDIQWGRETVKKFLTKLGLL